MGLWHERLLGRSAGRGPDLRATLRDVVTHRRIRQVAHVVFIDQPGQHPPGGVALLARCGQVDGEHRVDQRLGRVQLRRRTHRGLPFRRDRVLQCLPHRAPMHPVAVGQRPDRETIAPMITTYRLEQLHPRPRHFLPLPIAVKNTTSLRGGARSDRHNRARACRRWGRIRPSQWGQIRLTGPSRRVTRRLQAWGVVSASVRAKREGAEAREKLILGKRELGGVRAWEKDIGTSGVANRVPIGVHLQQICPLARAADPLGVFLFVYPSSFEGSRPVDSILCVEVEPDLWASARSYQQAGVGPHGTCPTVLAELPVEEEIN